MEKIRISLSQLQLITSPKSERPKDIWTEQEIECGREGSHTHYYKCPCGNGRVVDDKDTTPGFRSHETYIVCEECNKKYIII